jgi:hypothetical protein
MGTAGSGMPAAAFEGSALRLDSGLVACEPHHPGCAAVQVSSRLRARARLLVGVAVPILRLVLHAHIACPVGEGVRVFVLVAAPLLVARCANAWQLHGAIGPCWQWHLCGYPRWEGVA